MTASRLSKITWLVLIYNLFAVAFGAFVRASFSGDGCGSHWPLCDGEVIPAFASLEQVIEFSHRVSTGLILPMVIMLGVWARRVFPKGHQARKAVALAIGFTCLEAIIGAGLVKFQLVAENDSFARAWVMAFHVVSTFMLLGSLAALAVISKTGRQLELKGQGAVPYAIGLGFLGMIFLGISGAVSALGHTLMRTDNVIQAALQPDTHWMVRLQPLHPLIATSIGLYILLIGGLLIHLRPSDGVKQTVKVMVGVYALQMLVGLFSIFLKAPIAMQMIHLVLADVMIISMVAVSLEAMAVGVPKLDVASAAEKELILPEHRLRGWALVKEYMLLTKPRVISLLLFTTITAMFAAAGGWPGGWLLLAVAIGGYMSAGAANTINMVIDRDIDGTMKRTSQRPTVTQSISSRDALLFGFALALGSFSILWSAANLLCALLAFSGLVFYVIVYTLVLKRRTWHNIVIGGAAGAFPPLVGWAAVTNHLTPLAWYLFAIIFLWTPVHFWALALLIQDDYEKAGVPMLPVVLGERITVIQIALYAVLTAIISIMPLAQKEVGWLYVGSAAVLNIILLIRCGQLYRQTDRPHALSLYKYSMVYLAILFLMVAVDRAVVF